MALWNLFILKHHRSCSTVPRTLSVMLAMSHPMTQHQPPCFHEFWLPVILSEVVYHAWLMLAVLLKVCRKMWMRSHFLVMLDLPSEFHDINAQRHIFQPLVPLNSLGHRHYIPIMWTLLMSSSILGASGGGGKGGVPAATPVNQRWNRNGWVDPRTHTCDSSLLLLVIFSLPLNRLNGQKNEGFLSVITLVRDATRVLWGVWGEGSFRNLSERGMVFLAFDSYNSRCSVKFEFQINNFFSISLSH